MEKENKLPTLLKAIALFIAIFVAFYIIARVFGSIEIVIGIIILSFGILAIIWTLIARYSLSPKSNLRLFTNNFLACSIAVLSFAIIRLAGNYVLVPWLIYLEFFFVFSTFFFFVLASYYIYTLGKEFGFQHEASDIKKILKSKKKKPKIPSKKTK